MVVFHKNNKITKNAIIIEDSLIIIEKCSFCFLNNNLMATNRKNIFFNIFKKKNERVQKKRQTLKTVGCKTTTPIRKTK